jgi:hypothetical protein
MADEPIPGMAPRAAPVQLDLRISGQWAIADLTPTRRLSVFLVSTTSVCSKLYSLNSIRDGTDVFDGFSKASEAVS